MRMINTKRRGAFTLIELILVIVILGIVASIGSSIIANVYENYLLQRATHRASLKTELAAQQIANLLSYRIPRTTIARNPNDLTDNVRVTDDSGSPDTTHTLLEWIGYDTDGFRSTLRPGWNGFCDVDPSNQATLVTPGSNLTFANAVMSNLSNSGVSLGGAQYPAIFFRSDNNFYLNGSTPYDYTCLGMVNNDTTCISSVSSAATESMNFQLNAGVGNKLISEHYKLAWTAYAIRPQASSNGSGNVDLILHYNYQPWHGERLTAGFGTGTQSTIITNVTVFKFAESGDAFRFKLCAQENIGTNFNVTICKEKAVLL